MADLDSLIAEASSLVGDIISKPKMSPKYLGKPPFRFLHDTISGIIKTTGFAEDLYTAEECDSSTISEKESKMSYLQKIFTCVGICLVRSFLIHDLCI